ncbi:zf-HC2 domain-containing protein [Alcanivorax sp. 24]|uniref:anti-sigma factor family protein n=1 Tax=Alcanivorax sp. 24 TaxID=2545266 RepID=UPI001060925D|nr:zf-HC2 domain-containing protein [Alcanivorax sp. 24]
MLKCTEVVQRADALVDGTPLSFAERLALRSHLMLCRHCRRYVRQLKALTEHLREHTLVEPLDDETVNAILAHRDNAN